MAKNATKGNELSKGVYEVYLGHVKSFILVADDGSLILVDDGTTKTYFATSNWLANTGFDVGKLDNLKYMDKSDAKKFISNLGANLVVCDFKKSLVYMVQVTGCVYATWEAMSKEAQPSKVTRLVYDLDRLDNKDAKNAATLYLSSSNIGK